MLSKQELQNIQRALANNPSKSAERKLRNKLIEHDYASKYPPFSPLTHHQHFLNKTTSEQILHQLIDTAKISEIILLDTESITVHRQPNRPGLIQLQLQLIPNDAVPVVIIIEVHHLPPTDCNQFKLIQEFFRIVLDSAKAVYTWGTIEELIPFTTFNLFNTEQIYAPENKNLQKIFKKYWQLCHKHSNTTNCKCEDCLGKQPNQPWKLLDAVAHQLHEWLDKRHTCSPFNIGLDPQLQQLTTQQLEYRSILTNYAANDVLSMEKIMIDIQENPPPTSSNITSINHAKNLSEIQDENTMDETPAVLLLHPSSPIPITEQPSIPDQETGQQQHHRHRTKKENQQKREENNRQQHRAERNRQQKREEYNHQQHREEVNHQQQREERNRQQQREDNNRRQQREDNNRQQQREEYNHQQHREEVNHQQQREELNRRQQCEDNNRHQQREENDANIERKQKNRKSTIRQRRRHFRHEIIRRGIDPRFSVTIVKEILRRYEIPSNAVIISKSKLTRRTSLYIGIRNPSKIRQYESRTRNLFTTDYYNEFRARHRFRR